LITDSNDAAPADTGEPGDVDKVTGVEAPTLVRKPRVVPAQHGFTVVRLPNGNFQVGPHITVDGSNPAFAQQALNDLATLDATPTGRQVLDGINNGRHDVTISELPLANAPANGGGVEQGADAGVYDPARGANSTVQYAPTYRDTYTDANGKTYDKPSAAMLGHELIHALHDSQGNDLNRTPDPRDPTGNQEESQTIGINDHAGEPLTENNILSDLGAPFRRADHDSTAVPAPTP
jgi:hypothetical protein